MEKRNVSITLEKAKKWYQQGGDLKEVALQAYTESELVDWPDWPTDINDPRLDLGVLRVTIPTKIWYQWKLYKLLEVLNPKDFNPGYNLFYVPRVWWYRRIKDITAYEKYVGSIKTLRNETLYITIGGYPSGFSPGIFAYTANAYGITDSLKCATPKIQEHFEKYFWKDIIKAYCDETILKIKGII